MATVVTSSALSSTKNVISAGDHHDGQDGRLGLPLPWIRTPIGITGLAQRPLGCGASWRSCGRSGCVRVGRCATVRRRQAADEGRRHRARAGGGCALASEAAALAANGDFCGGGEDATADAVLKLPGRHDGSPGRPDAHSEGRRTHPRVLRPARRPPHNAHPRREGIVQGSPRRVRRESTGGRHRPDAASAFIPG